jgi:DNA-binding CsgD family transcriptional regulator
MSISISSALSTVAVTAANSSSNAAPVQRNSQPQPTSNQAGYTVQLSEAQQVYQLYNQRQQISQIAQTLNLSVDVVNTYLGNGSSG